MSILLFIVILVVLIIVHEVGHLLAAKSVGMRVDEFGVGYPPRAATLFEKGGTKYTLNWIPFGGFVRIFGENPDDESLAGEDSFVNKPKWAQALVLVAGVAFNIIFAWLLITAGFMSGLPAPVDYDGAGEVRDAELVITSVLDDSPASGAGLQVGDVVTALVSEGDILSEPTPETLQAFIQNHGDDEIMFTYVRGDGQYEGSATPSTEINPESPAVGISMDMIGTLKLGIFDAAIEGTKMTWLVTKAVVVGLGAFFLSIFTGGADLEQVTGPVGIVGLVGDASTLGFVYLLSFTAFISINLAVINLIPFPALDGGRLLFVLIEKIKGSPIPPKVANMFNGVGFALLILLMIVITVNDVVRLF